MLDSAKKAIENGNTKAEWKIVGEPRFGSNRTYPAIVFNGVQYGDELPEDLREAGVKVTNSKQDVVEG